VEVGDPPGDGQAEAGAAPTVGGAQRPERLEDALTVRDRHPGTVVVDLEPEAVAVAGRGDPHGAARGAVP
jgi:hypothetical protein